MCFDLFNGTAYFTNPDVSFVNIYIFNTITYILPSMFIFPEMLIVHIL